MAWFKVDDKLHEHKKGRDAGKAAMGVWVLAGSYCADNLTNGFVARRVLNRWGVPRDAAALVEAGLWLPGEHEGEAGWWFHDWTKFQPTKDKVEADRAAARERMRQLRSGERSAEQPANVHDRGVRDPVPSSPVPLSVVTSLGQSPSALAALTDEDWQKIERATKGPRSHAVVVATNILDRASSTVSNPRRYILRAIANEPEVHKFNRGNPTKDTECREHAGEWGDACRQCALEQRLGDLA